jgi:hypothetical protein
MIPQRVTQSKKSIVVGQLFCLLVPTNALHFLHNRHDK